MMSRPLATFEEITAEELNACLDAWNHKAGPLHRPFSPPTCHALKGSDGEPLAVTSASSLIPAQLRGGVQTRANTIELSRLCAYRSGLCRVMLRMWRELWLPTSGYSYAVSYQHRGWHDGDTYRFDGWQKLYNSSSGKDQRSGRPGYSKTLWLWSVPR